MKCQCGEDMVDADIPGIHEACPHLILAWQLLKVDLCPEELVNHDAILECNVKETVIKGEIKI